MASGNERTKWILIGAGFVAAVVLVALLAAPALFDSEPEELRPTPSTSIPPSTSVAPPTSSAPSSAAPEVSDTDVVVQTGLIERNYRVIAPTEVGAQERLPTVIALHGLGEDRNAMSYAADWRGLVARDRFIVAFPQGITNSWNMGECCPPAALLGIDDVGFIDIVVRELTDRPDVDSSRMYLSGFSNGAMFAYSYVCQRPDTFQALAPIAGSNLSRCAPQRPISLFHQHSDPDIVVPFDGQPSLGQLLTSADLPDVPTSVGEWAAADGCGPDPSTVTIADGVQRTTWPGCTDGTTVELVRLQGVGHNWPNKGDYIGVEEMLRFFDIG